MLNITLDSENAIVLLEPDAALSEQDFRSANAAIDPFIQIHGGLNGLIIHVHTFPGWDSFSAMVSHLTFIHEHHRKVRRIAVASDPDLGGLVQSIGSHLISAEIKAFGYDELAEAQRWILSS